MIAGAIAFNSGILLFADAEPIVPRRIPYESSRIFHGEYGSSLGVAHSVFVVSASVDGARALFQRCERALDAVPPAERTIDRMRETIEQSLRESYRGHGDWEPIKRELPFIVVLYSPCQLRYSIFRTISTRLQEVVGYDCQGATAYLGHYLIHDRYNAARSLDELDLRTVFSIAVDTLGGIREAHRCEESSEMVVVYANGHISDVQPIPHDSRRQRAVTLTRLAHSRRPSQVRTLSHHPDPS